MLDHFAAYDGGEPACRRQRAQIVVDRCAPIADGGKSLGGELEPIFGHVAADHLVAERGILRRQPAIAAAQIEHGARGAALRQESADRRQQHQLMVARLRRGPSKFGNALNCHSPVTKKCLVWAQ
jgi:hypothetical protein